MGGYEKNVRVEYFSVVFIYTSRPTDRSLILISLLRATKRDGNIFNSHANNRSK